MLSILWADPSKRLIFAVVLGWMLTVLSLTVLGPTVAAQPGAPGVSQITLSAYSEVDSRFIKDGVGFCPKSGGGGGGRGLNLAVINPSTGAIEDCRNFDTWLDKQAFITMADFVSNAILPGKIVLAAVADEAGFIRYGPPESNCHIPFTDPRIETGYQTLESLGSQHIRSVGYWGSWGLIAIKGHGALAEGYRDPEYAPAINGFCQMQARRSTQITATVSITPFQVFMPVVLLSP